VAEQKPEPAPKKPRRTGCLGCSFPVWIVLAALLIYGVVIGPIGRALLKLFGANITAPSFLSVPIPEVELPAEVVFRIGSFGVTNTIITTWITIALLALIFGVLAFRGKIIPGKFQAAVEFVLEWVYNLCKDVAGEKNGSKVFPVIVTIFLFVFINAWTSLIPGYGSILITEEPFEAQGSAQIQEINAEHGLKLNTEPVTIAELIFELNGNKPPAESQQLAEGNVKFKVLEVEDGEAVRVAVIPQVPILRGANTDFNTPFAIAIVSFLYVEYLGFASGGFGYLNKFFNFSRLGRAFKDLGTGKVKAGGSGCLFGGIDAFVGILELISEIFRLFSFTFRLFGNMTGGEILMLVFLFLTPFVVGLFPLGLELLVGVVQALIFSGLTLVFATIASAPHDEHL
jgi:F-type H+-transporting ATPase subunit a